jgi:hypothetical protein
VSAKWIEFIEVPASGVTKRWEIRTRSGIVIGRVQWSNGWRRYALCPGFPTEWEQDCLRDVADFIERETAEHKARVNGVMTRRPEAYAVSSKNRTVGGPDAMIGDRLSARTAATWKPLARLVQPFARPINICRDCRQKRTGIEDRRGLGPRTTITATIAEPQQLAPVRIAGLLTAGERTEP